MSIGLPTAASGRFNVTEGVATGGSASSLPPQALANSAATINTLGIVLIGKWMIPCNSVTVPAE
jgi:hypothetical protein